mmetsp:Transcript_21004/g.59936  ORF Transcript_21004/g.59936 Transcript_21004/m.59936 type:complete len:155 (+) Transcript_21004:1205-1669(+)
MIGRFRRITRALAPLWMGIDVCRAFIIRNGSGGVARSVTAHPCLSYCSWSGRDRKSAADTTHQLSSAQTLFFNHHGRMPGSSNTNTLAFGQSSRMLLSSKAQPDAAEDVDAVERRQVIDQLNASLGKIGAVIGRPFARAVRDSYVAGTMDDWEA